MKYHFLLFIFLFYGLKGKSHFNFGNEHAQCMEQILSLEFKKAEVCIQKGRAADPGNKIWLLLENYIDFLTATIGEERYQFIGAERMGKERLKQFELESGKSPWLLHAKAEVELQWAFARMKFGEPLTAAKEIARAYNDLEKNLKQYPGFLPSRKSMGLLKCLIGSMPDKYRWITDFKGLKGDINEGYKELNYVMEASSSDSTYAWLKDEAMFYLSFISLNLSPDEGFRKKIVERWKSIEDIGPLGTYAYSSLLMRCGRSADALNVLNAVKKSASAFPFHYLNYLKGMCLLYKKDTLCRENFRSYLEHFKGHTFRRSAWHKLAWSYLMEGDQAGYQQCLKKVPTTGSAIVDEDKLAMEEFRSGQTPSLPLLRSRLLFDGGYYAEALDVLLTIDPNRDLTSHALQLEAAYRLGRIQEKLGNTSQALNAYEWVITHTLSSDHLYFAPNAALCSGLLWEEKGEKEKAKVYFKKCLSYPDHQYKQSLDQKAQAGLTRLK